MRTIQWVLIAGFSWLLIGLIGCEDPDSLGRFRASPITNVILDELGAVDEEPQIFAGARDPRPEDLQVDAREYVVGPGDMIDISIFELLNMGQEWAVRRQISDTGRLTLPVLGTFKASGRTETELTDDIINKLRPHILKDPKVSVVVVGSRERAYSISGGAIQQPGRYPIAETDFRIAEALAGAGGVPQNIADYAYIIRAMGQERYDKSVAASRKLLRATSPFSPPVLPPETKTVNLDRNQPAPAVESPPATEKPVEKQKNPEQEILDSLSPMSVYAPMAVMSDGYPSETSQQPDKNSTGSPVDNSQFSGEELLENVNVAQPPAAGEPGKKLKVIRRGDRFEIAPAESTPPAEQKQPSGEGIDRRTPETSRPSLAESRLDEIGQAGQLQEVVRVDLKALQGGDPSQNIVIRQGDEIRVPANAAGIFYVMGQVVRPGPYSLSGNRMTLKRAIATAGPLTSLAWPSRCEITRIIASNTEVVYRVNLEKLLVGAAPDVFIKPDDVINIGSHPVARWIAVVRQSFRNTYGFGFVYDRNFADKDFGK